MELECSYEHLERIFTIFHRLIHVKNMKEYEGTGIGLANSSENCTKTWRKNMG